MAPFRDDPAGTVFPKQASTSDYVAFTSTHASPSPSRYWIMNALPPLLHSQLLHINSSV